FTERSCTLEPRTWIRCVAPVAVGNTYGHIQLQIRTPEPGQLLDIHVWGAQIERGVQPTEVSHNTAGFLSELRRAGLLRRFLPDKSRLQESADTRLDIAHSAWLAFTESPVYGVGPGRLTEHVRASPNRENDYTHAH